MYRGCFRTVCLECGGTFDSYSMTDRYAHYRSKLHTDAIDSQRTSEERFKYGRVTKNVYLAMHGELA